MTDTTQTRPVAGKNGAFILTAYLEPDGWYVKAQNDYNTFYLPGRRHSAEAALQHGTNMVRSMSWSSYCKFYTTRIA
jgi:hypothetical protein